MMRLACNLHASYDNGKEIGHPRDTVREEIKFYFDLYGTVTNISMATFNGHFSGSCRVSFSTPVPILMVLAIKSHTFREREIEIIDSCSSPVRRIAPRLERRQVIVQISRDRLPSILDFLPRLQLVLLKNHSVRMKLENGHNGDATLRFYGSPRVRSSAKVEITSVLGPVDFFAVPRAPVQEGL
jgi:hypothetical protein